MLLKVKASSLNLILYLGFFEFEVTLKADKLWGIDKAKQKKEYVSRSDFYKKGGGRVVFLLFIISYCMLSLHIITFPEGYVGSLRSSINKTKHQILIKPSLFNFDSHKGLTGKIYIILGCTQQQWASHIFDVIRTP